VTASNHTSFGGLWLPYVAMVAMVMQHGSFLNLGMPKNPLEPNVNPPHAIPSPKNIVSTFPMYIIVYSFCEHFGRRISDICEKMYNIITNCRRSSSKCRFPEIGVPPVIIHFNRIPYKQSFFGYPHLWKPQMCFQSKEWFVLDHRLHLYKSRAAQ